MEADADGMGELKMNMMLGYNVSNALRKNHVSVLELSRRLKVDRTALTHRINEPRLFTVDEVIRIGAAIGVNWRELLDGVE